MTTCHVVTHVHWDREWYRPWEEYRARLVELVARVCADLENETLGFFHLDGQTVTLPDVFEVRPELEQRVRDQVQAGRLSIGPWHVLADNQLVSGETLIRNLLAGRRWGARIGRLTGIGYSPDAFGHPGDLPRLLRGFGIGTALVWRGAPPSLARFRWRSADGSEVFAVNQAYHAAEVLWEEATATEHVADFLEAERKRLPEGPWLLLNGGDHLAPANVRAHLAGRLDPTVLVESSLEAFFDDAQRASPSSALPVVDGELRHLGDRLTFLLPGTLSTRTYLKQANDAAQMSLEHFAEPTVALWPAAHGKDLGLLEHAWDLVLKNAPHDSVCGCSVDEVHRHNLVRAEQTTQVADHLFRRGLLSQGLDTRVHGEPPSSSLTTVVSNGHGSTGSGPVEVEIVAAVDSFPVAVTGPDGEAVPFDSVDLGRSKTFEADLDLMPDTRDVRRHRLAFLAKGVPAFGWAAYEVTLGTAARDGVAPRRLQSRSVEVDGRRLAVEDDASITVVDVAGARVWHGLGRLVDGGDRGDTYNYDPPGDDLLVSPTVSDVIVQESSVRVRLLVDAALDVPNGLSADRNTRSDGRVALPVRIVVDVWRGSPDLYWTVSLDNTATDHRLRFHVPVPGQPTHWTGDEHWTAVRRPFGPVLGALPVLPAHEASIGVAPVHSYAAAGGLALFVRGLPEVQGLEAPATMSGDAELAVTLVRAVGWLSRFDLATRTTGAGPMFQTPEAQCQGPFVAHLAVRVDTGDDEFDVATAASRHRVPLVAHQLRTGTSALSPRSVERISVDGAMVSAVKPAEDGTGVVVRLSNPTTTARTARVRFPGTANLVETRLDETLLRPVQPDDDGVLYLDLQPFGVRTLATR